MVSPAHAEETEFALVRFDGNEEQANIYEGFGPLSARDVAEAIFFMASPTCPRQCSDGSFRGSAYQ